MPCHIFCKSPNVNLTEWLCEVKQFSLLRNLRCRNISMCSFWQQFFCLKGIDRIALGQRVFERHPRLRGPKLLSPVSNDIVRTIRSARYHSIWGIVLVSATYGGVTPSFREMRNFGVTDHRLYYVWPSAKRVTHINLVGDLLSIAFRVRFGKRVIKQMQNAFIFNKNVL